MGPAPLGSDAVPTDKRERQRAARVAKTQAQQHRQKRSDTKKRVRNVAVILAIVLVAAFLFSLTAGDDDDTAATTTTAASGYTNPELAAEVLAREPPEVEPAPPTTPKGEVQTETLIAGEGDGAAQGDSLVVHYHGVLPDGTVLDESWSRGEPFPVEGLGSANVIAGWNQGLVGVKIGERRLLIIGSDLAYGPEGDGGQVPPNAPLAFAVDVVDIQPGAGATPTPSSP
jgi:peptidylprolyl isomerase